jgi:adenosylmethionine-8-amino-7-oxononanoate aminotransferase
VSEKSRGARDVAAPPWLERGLAHLWRPYTQAQTAPPPLPVVRTEGARLVLADGRVLVDGIASWWTACHGYNHPHIRARVMEQLDVMPHVMLGGLAHEPACALATRLADALPDPLDHVFFSDSGSVAVEVAMKIAVQHFMNRGLVEKSRFVAFEGAYHGDTFMTMRVCDPNEGMHAKFARVSPPERVVPLPVDDDGYARFDAFLASVAHETAAVLIEPFVQCAGGMRFHDVETLRALRRSCDAHGVLLIFDEIATGFMRTGPMFATTRVSSSAMGAIAVVPDIVTLGKALTGGTLPLAATVATRALYESFLDDSPDHALMHGPTFMGNPLACTAALASLDLFESEPRHDEVARLSAWLKDGLSPFATRPHVKNVRVMGAIGVVEMERGHAPSARAFTERGAFIRPIGDVVYLMPAFTITEREVAVLVDAIDGAIER